MVRKDRCGDLRGVDARPAPYRSGDDSERLSPAEAAFREWTFFVAILKLPDELYWELSPREIEGCILEHYRYQDVINTRFGTVCATLANVQPHYGKGKKKMLEWTHFFRSIMARKTKKSSLAEARADVIASMEALQSGGVKQK